MSEPRRGTAIVNGITLAYRHWPRTSEATCPAVVLLHGGLQTGEGMRHLAEQLALDGEVLVPDLRGRGESERPADGYDPATMADDVAALVRQLGVERPVVVGRLHGGLVAYHLAARHPDLPCGVVLGNANPEVSPEHAARRLAVVAALPRQFGSQAEAMVFYTEGLGLSTERARHDIPIDLETAPDGTLQWRYDLAVVAKIEDAAMPRADWDVLARVRCPVLILRGQRGEIGPATIARMLATMPAARAQTIIGAGHDVFLGPGSEQTVAAIQLFLRGLAEGDGRPE
jgi:pimeloyl-ACP methyl ester carboxylesterase